MNEGKPPDKDAAGPATRPLKDSDAGQVSFRQGKAVWEWNTRTGAFNLEETTMLVQRLDNPDLKLEESVAQRDLKLRGEIAVQAQAQSPRPAESGQEPPDIASPEQASPSQAPVVEEGSEESSATSAADDWALQTWAPKTAKRGDGNPYDSAAPAGRGPPGEDRGRRTDWELRSGPTQLPKEPRTFNPYGDDPPPRRKR